jgi:hypothetical protein
MIHSIIDIIIGLALWKFIPGAVGLKDRGIERGIKVVLMIVGILMVIKGAVNILTWIL